MSEMQTAQNISQLVSSPRVRWTRIQDTIGTEFTTLQPIEVGQVTCDITDIYLVLGDAYGAGSPTDAGLVLSQCRGGVTIDSQSWAFDAGWSVAEPILIGSVSWEFRQFDVLTVSVEKYGSIILPSLLLIIPLTVQ